MTKRSFSNIKILFFLLALTFINLACRSHGDQTDGEITLYDAAGKTVITSYANNSQQVIATLYGNAEAVKAALEGNTGSTPGAVATLVTWSQRPNRLWYGSYINGALRSVETIRTIRGKDGQINTLYELSKGLPPRDHQGRLISSHSRIQFIYALRPSVFP